MKLMMLRSVPVCHDQGARQLLQVHDELVYEVPTGIVSTFIPKMQDVLQLPAPASACPSRWGQARRPVRRTQEGLLEARSPVWPQFQRRNPCT